MQLSVAAGATGAPWFHGGTELSSRIAGDQPTHGAAIPHRILHCSWLI